MIYVGDDSLGMEGSNEWPITNCSRHSSRQTCTSVVYLRTLCPGLLGTMVYPCRTLVNSNVMPMIGICSKTTWEPERLRRMENSMDMPLVLQCIWHTDTSMTLQNMPWTQRIPKLSKLVELSFPGKITA